MKMLISGGISYTQAVNYRLCKSAVKCDVNTDQHPECLRSGTISIMLALASDRTDEDNSLVRHELCQNIS